MANKFLDLVQSNIDEYGILSSRDKGDSPLDLTDLMFCAYIDYINNFPDPNMEALQVGDYFKSCIPKLMILDPSDKKFYGLARRHPDSLRWYGQFNRMSCDQMHWMLGLAIADPSAFKAFMHNWSRRAFLLGTNTQGNSDFDNRVKLPDVTGPGLWAYALRCNAISKNAPFNKLLRPVMELFDISLVANSFIRVYWFGKNRNETDSRNHLKAMGLAKLVGDTFMAKLSRRIYLNMPIKFPERLTLVTPVFGGGTVALYQKHEGALQEIEDYFNSNGGVSGLANLWAPVIKWILE